MLADPQPRLSVDRRPTTCSTGNGAARMAAVTLPRSQQECEPRQQTRRRGGGRGHSGGAPQVLQPWPAATCRASTAGAGHVSWPGRIM